MTELDRMNTEIQEKIKEAAEATNRRAKDTIKAKLLGLPADARSVFTRVLESGYPGYCQQMEIERAAHTDPMTVRIASSVLALNILTLAIKGTTPKEHRATVAEKLFLSLRGDLAHVDWNSDDA